MWAFVAPGLYAHEKKMALPIIVSSTLLFFAGMAFAYFVVFPSIFRTFVSFLRRWACRWRPTSTSTGLCADHVHRFGITFETPVVLNRADARRHRDSRAARRVSRLISSLPRS